MEESTRFRAMTKKEVATELGVSVKTLSRWLRRVRKELLSLGYNERDKILTPKIVEYLFDRFC